MNFWKKWLPFLFVNMIISAGTTLLVLTLWTRANPAEQLTIEVPPTAGQTQIETLLKATLPPLDQEVITISNVFGAGNLENEYVVVSRAGQGNLILSGWSLVDEQENSFTFPDFELMQGELEIHSRSGSNTASKLYWNANEPIWSSGEKARILDSSGQERASFIIP